MSFCGCKNTLHKTIIFITHDFDEAIRLADRIAIMKDGLMVQVGTPEELVTNPATKYVEDFTSHVAKSKVLSVRSAMAVYDPNQEYAGSVAATDLIANIAITIEAADQPFYVVDEKDEIVGSINKRAVIDILLSVEV